MDSFFVHSHDFYHPYNVKLWCTSCFENTEYLLTFDGVKIRLFDYGRNFLIREKDFLNHEGISYIHPIQSPLLHSKALFVFVKNRRELIVFDEMLNCVQSLSLDTKVIILSMIWSQKYQTLYVSGNFGWIRALCIKIHTSIAGTMAEWEPKWSNHDSGQWMEHLVLDEDNKVLFGASGKEIYVFSINDGSIIHQFNTGQAKNISRIRYSKKHLALYTSSADGTIKAWRIQTKSSVGIQSIDASCLGPILIEIDDESIFTFSHNRIIQRYDLTTGSLIGQTDVDKSTPLDRKNVEAVLGFGLAYSFDESMKREWVFKSEGMVIAKYEALYAPKRLFICSDVVLFLKVDRRGSFYTLCKNNVLHKFVFGFHDSIVYDLDRMPLKNTGESHSIVSNPVQMIIQNELIFIAYASGEIKVLDMKSNSLFEMDDPDLISGILTMCIGEGVLTAKHRSCQQNLLVENLLLTTSSRGGIRLHCSLCTNAIETWRITKTGLIQLEMLPMQHYMVGIEKRQIHLFQATETDLEIIYSLHFDEKDEAQVFVFATETIIIVGFDNGKASAYHIDLHSHHKIQISYSLKMHDLSFKNMISCRDLLNIRGGFEILNEEKLDGLAFSIDSGQKMCIVDGKTGTIQYNCDIPEHVTNHTIAIFCADKIYILLAIDKMIRLQEWPSFSRIEPTPPPSPISEKLIQTSKPSIIGYSVEEEEEEESIYDMGFSQSKHNIMLKGQSSESDNELNSISSIIHSSTQSLQNKPIYVHTVPKEERPTMELVFENGWPKIQVSNNQEDEIEFENQIPLSDLIKSDNQPYDDAMKKNQEKLFKMIENDPYIAQAFSTKSIKSIKRIQTKEISPEMFYDLFLSINVTHLPKESLQNRPKTNTNKSSTFHSPHNEARESGRTADSSEIYGIKPLGNKKERKKAHHFIVLEMNDGRKITINELTADILCKLGKKPNNNEVDLTPGFIFQRALNEMKHGKKRNKKIFVRAQDKVALPIITLTPGGYSVGANQKRFFDHKKTKYIDQFTNVIKEQESDLNIQKTSFMHWEGVSFMVNSVEESPRVINITSVDQPDEEETIDESNENPSRSLIEQVLEKSRRPAQESDDSDYVPYVPSDYHSIIQDPFSQFQPQKNNSSNSTSFDNPVSFARNNGSGGFNLFGAKDDIINKLLDTSPSLKAYSDMLGTADNPLMDLLNNAPVLSKEELDKQLNHNKTDPSTSASAWNPMDELLNSMKKDDTFSNDPFSILKSRNPVDLSNKRPLSPRPMIALSELSNKLSFNPNFLPVISESNFDIDPFSDTNISENISPELSPHETSSEDTNSTSSSPRTGNLPRVQSVIQEQLQRNDFRNLKGLLSNAGLIYGDSFIDIPRWQPTINFVSYHQRSLQAWKFFKPETESPESVLTLIEEEEEAKEQDTSNIKEEEDIYEEEDIDHDQPMNSLPPVQNKPVSTNEIPKNSSQTTDTINIDNKKSSSSINMIQSNKTDTLQKGKSTEKFNGSKAQGLQKPDKNSFMAEKKKDDKIIENDREKSNPIDSITTIANQELDNVVIEDTGPKTTKGTKKHRKSKQNSQSNLEVVGEQKAGYPKKIKRKRKHNVDSLTKLSKNNSTGSILSSHSSNLSSVLSKSNINSLTDVNFSNLTQDTPGTSNNNQSKEEEEYSEYIEEEEFERTNNKLSKGTPTSSILEQYVPIREALKRSNSKLSRSNSSKKSVNPDPSMAKEEHSASNQLDNQKVNENKKSTSRLNRPPSIIFDPINSSHPSQTNSNPSESNDTNESTNKSTVFVDVDSNGMIKGAKVAQNKQKRTISRKSLNSQNTVLVNNDQKKPINDETIEEPQVDTVTTIIEEHPAETQDSSKNTRKKPLKRPTKPRKTTFGEPEIIAPKNLPPKEEDEEELLQKLIQKTAPTTKITTIPLAATLSQNDKENVNKPAQQTSREKSLGLKLELLKDTKEFQSLTKQQVATKKPTSKITRNKSMNNIIGPKSNPKPTFKVLSETELAIATTVFLSFDCPTLWEKRRPKLRRNSM